ncbi:acetyl-CoA synthetase-like protein [Dendrothele bispora CBS 962.96]|uniref:Acetyl-CoA synthetase-like protein n=1 Tax=Dendrothele bispora (strain CBS 962.96) TaxID=1314807 RepID=A0A4V4HBS3_DENBC|nr:acetyl-CoA synthetase-like protein [Dendrothele bispora CBS 962.96]
MLRLSSVRSRALGPVSRRHVAQLSVVQGPTDPPLDERTLPAYFSEHILANFSHRPALTCRSEAYNAHNSPSSLYRNSSVHSCLSWDFAEFDRHIDSLARGLIAMGVNKGDRVAVIMGNNSAYAMLQWAVARIGAVLVTINPAYRVNELAETLKLVGTQHLFVSPRIRTSTYVEMLLEKFPSIRTSNPGSIAEEGLPTLKNLIVVDNDNSYRDQMQKLDVKSAVDWREILLWREDTQEKQAVRDLTRSLQSDEVINLQFTSGTTGAPKAVSLTHKNLLNNARLIGRCMYLTENDVLCNVPPLFHCFGLVLGNLSAWVYGSSIVYPSPVFDPPSIVDALVAEKCTALHGVPTHFLGVLAEVTKRRERGEQIDTPNLRTGIAAGSSVPIELMRRLISELNLRDLTNAYGMTETSPVSFQTTPADNLTQRTETVGKIHPHVQMKVLDPDGNPVPRGKPGEIVVAGYLLQKGYWNDEEQTNKVIKVDEEGTRWMYTGDEGILDEDGYLKIVGRIKDIIIRGGENLFPVQIEDVLLSKSDGKISEAAAVAVKDPKYGEVVGIWVVRSPSDKEQQQLTRQQIREIIAKNMNPQNSPAWVWFIGEDGPVPSLGRQSQDQVSPQVQALPGGVPKELPKTASGKVMKHVLRAWSKELSEKDIGKVNNTK